MANDTLLKFLLLANGQVDQYLTANEAMSGIAAAFNDCLDVDLSGGPVTLTTTEPPSAIGELFAYFVFKCSGHTSAEDLVIPANKRFFAVLNDDATYDVNVVVGSTSIAVSASSGKLFYADGTADGLFALS